VKYDDRMDKECLVLCDALNALPGIRTFESCCGHGEYPFRVWFFCNQVQRLAPIIEGLDHAWRVEASHVDCPYRVVFMLEGPQDPAGGDKLAPYLHVPETASGASAETAPWGRCNKCGQPIDSYHNLGHCDADSPSREKGEP
jgi:hypothetical protein